MNAELIGALQEAASHFGEGHLSEAESICRRLIVKYPKAVDAIHLLALISKQRGDFSAAERLFHTCIRIDSRRADVNANLGNLLSAAGRPDEAADAYRRSLRIDASFRPARLGLARLLNDIGSAGDAALEAQMLIGQNAGDAEAWSILGSSHRHEGRAADAEAAFREAIRLNPNYAAARHNLGALLAHLSRSEGALAELDSAARLGIRGPEIDVNRASALMALQRFDEAEQLLENTVRSIPAAINAQILLARIRFMRGTPGFADAFAAAIKVRPEDVPLRLAYSRILRGAGTFDEALQLLEAANATDATDARLPAELAAIHMDAGHFDRALHFARTAEDLDPSLIGLDDLLIDVLTCLGQASDAKPLVDAARRREPLNQWYIAMQATIARLLGDPSYATLYDYGTFVRSYNLPKPNGWASIDDFHRDLISALTVRHGFQSQPLDQSLRHGTQTPRGLLGDPDPVIEAFLKSIQHPIAKYREEIGFDPDHPYRSRNRGDTELTGCWSVRLNRDGYHVNHVHSEGWISSAYYVQVPPEVGNEDRKSGWLKFGEPRFPVPGATAQKMVQPAVGRLVLFPSYMWHGTTPITGDEPRMTIAFDVVPKDE